MDMTMDAMRSDVDHAQDPKGQALDELRPTIDDLLQSDDLHDHPLFHDDEFATNLVTDIERTLPQVDIKYDEAGSIQRVVVLNKPSDQELEQVFLRYNYARHRANHIAQHVQSESPCINFPVLVEELRLWLGRAQSLERFLVLAHSDLANILLRRTSRRIQFRQDSRSERLGEAWRSLQRAVQRFNLLESTSFQVFAVSWIKKDGDADRKKEIKRKKKNDVILDAADGMRPSKARTRVASTRRKGLAPKDVAERVEPYSDGISRSDDDIPDVVAQGEIEHHVGADLRLRVREGDLNELERAELICQLAGEKAFVPCPSGLPSAVEYAHLVLWERDWLAHWAKLGGDLGTW